MKISILSTKCHTVISIIAREQLGICVIEKKSITQIAGKNLLHECAQIYAEFEDRISWHISNTRNSSSSGYPNTEKRIPVETLFQVFDIASQTINNSWKNQSKSSQNFTLIKIRYPNHRHGSDFLLISLYSQLSS